MEAGCIVDGLGAVMKNRLMDALGQFSAFLSLCFNWFWDCSLRFSLRMKASMTLPVSYTQTTTFVAVRHPSPLCLLLIGMALHQPTTITR